MQALLTVIVIWLSANFDLPTIHEHPRVEFLPASKIATLRHTGRPSSGQLDGTSAPAPAGQRATVAVYDDATKTISLPEGWTGSTPAEVSILVHEMVHHLQNLGKQRFECPQEREKLAYAAQEKWLSLFGHDLLSDFEIDPFTLLVSTRCIY
jgi:Domain of unknown function (DUF6647)